jgi:acyl-CoA hydrolase
MDKTIAKHVSDSKAAQFHIVLYEDLNGFNRLFGGRLMEWIDITAAVVARRHSNCNVTTACIDNLQFIAPAYINDTIVIDGYVTFVGKTSMEVCVNTFVEKLDGTRRKINTAYVVLVAIDEAGQPLPVPALITESEIEKREFEAGKRRRELRRDAGDAGTRGCGGREDADAFEKA